MAGSIIAYCSCRNPDTGKRWPQGQCPDWNRRGHKRWGWALDLPKVWDEDTGRWRRQQARRMSYARKIDAERALAREIPAVEAGTAPSLPDRQVTVAEYLDRWLGHDPSWRPTTRANYARDVRLYIRPALGGLRLVDVRPADIAGMFAKMRDGSLRPPGLSGPTGPAAARSVYTTLRNSLAQAMAEQRITWNPCRPVKVPPAKPAPTETWTPDQVTRFLEHARKAEPDLAAAFALAAWWGPRRGEIAALRWDDVDLDAGTLTIARNVAEVSGQLHVGEPKMAKGRRIITISTDDDETTARVLRAHRRRQAERRLVAGAWEDEGWVFPAGDGRLMPPHRLTHTFKRLTRDLPDLPSLHFHGLRHTAATILLDGGTPVQTVSEILGHKDASITLKVYTHVLQRQRDRAAAVVGDVYGSVVMNW